MISIPSSGVIKPFSTAPTVDFINIDKAGKKELIQVSWSLDDAKTGERVERALQQAEQELGFGGRIITLADYLRSEL